METKRKPVLLSDAPVDVDGDLIWKGTEIGFDLDLMVEAILHSTDPLVFAVHGPWGSGKTSFLKMVESKLKQQQEQTIHVSWYTASTYQGVGDVSTTLTLRLMRTLSEIGTRAAADELYDRLLKPAFEAHDEVTGTYGFLQELAGKVGVLADLGVVIGDFLDGVVTSGRSKLVIMVDDLDRCSLEHIGDLIETLQRLNSVNNLFIFLAVDQLRLQNALKKRFEDIMGERSPRWASEKYIQHAIILPPLDDHGLTQFIQRLFLPKEEMGDNTPSYDPVSEAIIGSLDYFLVAVRHRIPRTIKACINIIRPVLRREMERHDYLSEDEKRKIVKKQLIAYLFRDFYDRWLVTAEEGRNLQNRRFFTALESLCIKTYQIEEASSESYAHFLFNLDRLLTTNLLKNDALAISEELAKLLTVPPYFCYVQRMSAVGKIGLKDQLQHLYDKSEEAEEIGDAQNSIKYAIQAYELVTTNRQALGNVAPTVGNLALNAETFDVADAAEVLHRLALEIDPTHVNIRQNFAEFILKNRPNLYPEALDLVNAMYIRKEEHKPYRTLGLLIELKRKLRLSTDEEEAQLMQLAEEADTVEAKGDALYYIIAKAKMAIEGTERFVKLIAMEQDRNALFNLQSRVADALYTHNVAEIEFLAMDLYRQLLSASPTVNLNYPFLLNKHGYKEEAGCLWFKSYIKGEISRLARKSYAKYLTEAGEAELALKVIRGEHLPITEPVLIKSGKELPMLFSPPGFHRYLSTHFEVPEPYSCT
jgi:hypothetical protein